jgi:hypothetical protein
MYKSYLFIASLLFSNISFGMELSTTSPHILKNNITTNNQNLYNSSYCSRTNQQVKKQNGIKPITSIHNSLKSSSITKPHNKIEEKKQPFRFIHDKYTVRRGEPKMLDIYCDECRHLLIQYQKDGPGRLLRCYLDRIHSPQTLKSRQYEYFNVRTSPNLSCNNCRLIIGTPMIYKSENRPAYNMKSDRFYIKESK